LECTFPYAALIEIEVNERQVNIRWMPAIIDGILENVTVVVSLDIQ
jgi:hypothetical protein